MKKRNVDSSSGFTLVELLITLLLFAVIIGSGSAMLSGTVSQFHTGTRNDVLSLFFRNCVFRAKMRNELIRLNVARDKVSAVNSPGLSFSSTDISPETLEALKNLSFTATGTFLLDKKIDSLKIIFQEAGNKRFEINMIFKE
ncbi:MAG: prepilin-type N-terminal cleavage/methylation domain-containing protein [Candidatus Riflebacteria bacterium]|nr:prepilin-type N-terminal cleavage/methylation domain-containing protein [Candidatus Riflebacteria bacterium]